MAFGAGYYTRAILVPVPPIVRGLVRGAEPLLRRSAIAKQCLGAKARGTSGYCRPFRLIATPNGPSKPFVICAKGLPPLGYFQ